MKVGLGADVVIICKWVGLLRPLVSPDSLANQPASKQANKPEFGLDLALKGFTCYQVHWARIPPCWMNGTYTCAGTPYSFSLLRPTRCSESSYQDSKWLPNSSEAPCKACCSLLPQYPWNREFLPSFGCGWIMRTALLLSSDVLQRTAVKLDMHKRVSASSRRKHVPYPGTLPSSVVNLALDLNRPRSPFATTGVSAVVTAWLFKIWPIGREISLPDLRVGR
jgi:hypothetical protein